MSLAGTSRDLIEIISLAQVKHPEGINLEQEVYITHTQTCWRSVFHSHTHSQWAVDRGSWVCQSIMWPLPLLFWMFYIFCWHYLFSAHGGAVFKFTSASHTHCHTTKTFSSSLYEEVRRCTVSNPLSEQTLPPKCVFLCESLYATQSLTNLSAQRIKLPLCVWAA